ncbi:unnamed protein product [Rangifer tarandus platyrhynchus]|uniref:Uncharacterized protein n=2 Tax=Rangifer tarandus platyrhynchus TaxID=3082113 RepID=A0ABN8Y2H0_RANTA|nr:unnamed protein product [Rangifer tarandus platyrhynchus]
MKNRPKHRVQSPLERRPSPISMDRPEMESRPYEFLLHGKPSQYTVPLRKWQPTPAILPGKFHGWRSLVGYSLWGCKETDTTEQLHFFTLTPFWGSFQPFSKQTAQGKLLGFHIEELTTPTPLTLVLVKLLHKPLPWLFC